MVEEADVGSRLRGVLNSDRLSFVFGFAASTAEEDPLTARSGGAVDIDGAGVAVRVRAGGLPIPVSGVLVPSVVITNGSNSGDGGSGIIVGSIKTQQDR